MNRIIIVAVALVELTAPSAIAAGEDSSGKFPNYSAGIRAIKDRDCKGITGYLNAYLQKHPDIREKYPEHYEDVRIAIGQCAGKIIISGVGDESLEIDPLPDHPPMKSN